MHTARPDREGPATDRASSPRWDVLFLLLPDTLILDWAGPAEALRMANLAMQQQGQAAPFHLRFVSPHCEARSSVGVMVCGLEPLPGRLEHPSWLVLLGQPGQHMAVDSAASQAALCWLQKLVPKTGALELLTICAGAVLAAHAGLLQGKRATTHHQHLEELQAAAPLCQVVNNRVFVEDAPVYSSAGVTTGVDLILQRIGSVCGLAVAAQVAQTMVVAMRRGPQDPELSPFLAHRNHLHPALHRVQDAVSQAPATDWNVTALADIAHTSPRHLTRLFVEHAGVAPLAYLRQIRLAVAQQALQSGRNVTQAAELAGFSSDTQLRRAWRQFGASGTPSQGR
jgi:transcriptional regulator GlxA family with amidase domain